MGTSIELSRNDRTEDRTTKCSLVLRSHDMGGVDREHLATLTMEQGISVNLGERSIFWQHDVPYHRDQEPGTLLIKLRSDAERGQAPWALHLNRGDGNTEHMCFINSDKADAFLGVMGRSVFEDYEADWKDCGRMMRRHEVEALRAKADEIEAGLAAEEADDTPEMD